MTGVTAGRLIGIGTGPGDPELMTLKAVNALRSADVVAFFAKAGSPGNAHASAAPHLSDASVELPLLYPVTTEIAKDAPAYREAIDAFYAASAEAVAAHLDAGRTVAVLSEGDPLFYGSYMHLHVRLSGRYETEVIPGVTGMSACWSDAGVPIAQGDDTLCVLMGTAPEAELVRRLADCDAAVVMKVGRNLPKVRRALATAGRLERAVYVERGGRAGSRVVPMAVRGDESAPYFSIVLLPGWETRG